MYNKITKCLVVSSLILIPTFSFAGPIPEKDTGNLGEIRQSLLTVEAFQRIYGKGWVLMRGQRLKGDEDIVKEGLWEGRLPDARGVFLRGHNHDRDDGLGNPENTRLGHYQKDSTAPNGLWIPSHYIGHSNKVPGHHGWWGADGTHNEPRNHYMRGDAETRPRCITVNTYIKINRTKENLQLKLIMDAIDQIPQRILNSDLFRRVLTRFQLINQ
jgi:hypothetical protein